MPITVRAQQLTSSNNVAVTSAFEDDDEMLPSTTAERNDIRTRTFEKIDGVASGYHIIANTFSKKKYRNRFVSAMKKKGLPAYHFKSPDENYSYVSIKHHENWSDAVADYDSDLDGKYTDDVWILIVTGEDVQEIASNESVKGSKSQLKLLKRANEHFETMRYAEAAKYYDLALKNNPSAFSKEILQKAGDAFYFNSNMEKAHHWYEILYENHKDEISAENLFKYAHALKGTSKYGKAKRMMRLYKRKVKDEQPYASTGIKTREAILDGILEGSEQAEIKNLSINSVYSDFSPMYYGEDKVVYASAKDSGFLNTRRYKWNNQPYLDLYVSKINERSQDLGASKRLSKKINSKYHEASVTFSPDGETMYFTRNNTQGKKVIFGTKKINFLKIYRSRMVDGEWSEPEELPFNGNDYSTGHPALSPDGDKLYFVSDRPGTIGKTDIFYVLVNEDGSFSEPINLGPEINTRGREMFPFINDKKLYFSSDGHVGLGGLDIFEAVRSEDGFELAKNMGQPINSRLDDFSYIVKEDTQEGYFASNRKGGKGDDDIYSFKRLVPEETVENRNAISGIVTELVTGDTMPNALVVLLDKNNRKLMEVVTDENGAFLFEDLEGNTNYIVKAAQEEFFAEEQHVATRDNELVTTDMALKRMKEMIAVEDGVKKLKTDIIYFDFDQSYIRRDASEELDKLVEVMTTYEDMVIKIESHTDAIGPKAYNKYLSDKRAKSTRDYLIAQGIDASRIESAIGYGEERPLNDCSDGVRCSKQRHQENRRSEFIIVKM